MVFPYAGCTSMILAFTPSNFAGSTKKLTSSGMIFVAYAAGNISGPLSFKATQAPGYSDGKLDSLYVKNWWY